MGFSDTSSILRDLPPGREGLSHVLDRLARGVSEILSAGCCEVWVIDSTARATHGFRLAASCGAPIGAVPHPSEWPWPDAPRVDPDLTHASLSAVGAIEPLADGGSEARFSLGIVGFIAATREGAAVDAAAFDRARLLVAALREEIHGRFPEDEIESFQQWLRMRGEIDRRVARAFARVQTLEEIASAIDAFSEELTPTEYSGLYFVDPDTGAFRMYVGRGLSADEIRAAESTALLRHPGLVLRTGVVLDAPDVALEPDVGMPQGHGRPVGSRLFIPVSADGRIVGAIGFANTHPHAYTARHRQVLSYLADFAGLAYARFAAQRALARRGELLEATNLAIERVLGALEWQTAAYASLALLGGALRSGAIALLELPADGRMPAEYVWQPNFGLPWLRAEGVRRLSATTRAALERDEGMDFDPEDGGPPLVLKPVFGEDGLWGVLAVESRSGGARPIDRAERSAIRTLARAFGSAIARERSMLEHNTREKAEVVTRLASRFAQDFNTELWPILLYTEMLERSEGLDARARQQIAEMRAAARRSSKLVEQLLAVAQSTDRVVELVDIAELAIEVSHLLRIQAGRAIEIETNIDADVGGVLGETVALRQSLLELGQHGIASVGDLAGSVRLTVAHADHDGRDHVRISLEHDGAAPIFDEHGRVLEPRPSNARNAQDDAMLGLVVLQRTVADSGGSVRVAPRAEGGGVIEVLLPRVGAMAAVEHTPISDTAASTAEAPKVLVVDDDAAVLAMLREVLEAFGYDPIACPDAAAALEQYENGLSPDLVLTDLTMPGMNGIELTTEIRRRGHATPIICCTGFVEESTERAGLAAGMRAFVRKPVDWDHLRRVLNDALASSETRAR